MEASEQQVMMIRQQAAAAAERRAQHEADLAEHWRIEHVDDAQRIIREFHGIHAARWTAGEAGISSRTARRWLSSTPPASRVDAVIDLARQLVQLVTDEFEEAEAAAAAALDTAIIDARETAVAQAADAAAAAGPALAAPKIRGMTGASVGTRVSVLYEDDGDGDRDIYDVDIDFGGIADFLEDGDLDAADEEFDRAVLDDYGQLGDTLTVDDYPDGIRLY